MGRHEVCHDVRRHDVRHDGTRHAVLVRCHDVRHDGTRHAVLHAGGMDGRCHEVLHDMGDGGLARMFLERAMVMHENTNMAHIVCGICTVYIFMFVLFDFDN